jgi:hypothetical protein
MKNYKIYALKLKDDNNIKYIGLTGQSLEKRLKEHIFITIKRNTKNGNWIKKHKGNIEIILIEGDISSTEGVNEREIYWIEHYTNLGISLTNSTLGGYFSIPTDVTRKKLSDSGKLRKQSEETKNKLSIINTGKKMSDIDKLIRREKMGIIIPPNKGIPMSEEQKIKLSYKLKGKSTSKSKPLDVFDRYGIFIKHYNSTIECAIDMELNRRQIYEVLNGRRKTYKGFIFRYESL